MNNQEILKERWIDTDKYLQEYLKKYKKENQKTKDHLQDLFNTLDISYQDINKSVPNSLKSRLNRKIEEWDELGILKDYFGYQARAILKKRKITYKEYINIMLLGIYYQEKFKLDEINDLVFYKICESAYNQGAKDSKKKKFKIFTHEVYYLIANIPILEATIEDYMNLYAQECANEMYKATLINIQNDIPLDINSLRFKAILDKQSDKLLNVKKNIDNPTGIVANITDVLVNNSYLQFGKENDIKKCRFIAVHDKKTTKMCKSLDNQIFNINGINKFKRYSALTDSEVEYVCKGMELGLNLPPITNHFHWCRSTITYQINNEALVRVVSRNNETITDDVKEQYNRYKKYFGEELSDSINDFVKIKNNPDKWEKLKQEYKTKKKEFNNK